MLESTCQSLYGPSSAHCEHMHNKPCLLRAVRLLPGIPCPAPPSLHVMRAVRVLFVCVVRWLACCAQYPSTLTPMLFTQALSVVAVRPINLRSIHGLQVEELKQHINMLQAVGYNAMEGEDVSPHREDGTAAEGISMRSLEGLLLAKNRHLEHELTMARLQVADLTGMALVIIFCNSLLARHWLLISI